MKGFKYEEDQDSPNYLANLEYHYNPIEIQLKSGKSLRQGNFYQTRFKHISVTPQLY